jgi:[acyl-carrier-protein] S-malonyltransferase
MKVAFLFPGQGTEVQQSAWDWRQRSDIVRALTDASASALEIPVSQLLGGQGVMRTEWFQPVLTAICLGIARELARHGLQPATVAGHSLGEVTAVAFAGAITDEAAIALAVERGRLMAREAARHPGGMVALERPDERGLEDLIALGRAHGVAQLAAHNTERQWVIAGDWTALRAIAAAAPATPLPVTGPWHSEAMEGAVEEYRQALRTAITNPLTIPLVCNRYGRLLEPTDDLIDLLARQFTHPVQWVRTMDTLASLAVTDFVTIGPGKAVRSLIHRAVPRDHVHPVEQPDDLPRVIQALAR